MSTVRLTINGLRVHVPAGISVATAIALVGQPFRHSVTGEPRAPLCGMGVCFECRVRIDGVAQQRACQRVVNPGMRVETDG
ncbi:(2Fe-2S)-binding protein [Luteibacter jiangsuensis]|nr:(2Fe-2S)-binding protein [Luteibacter jiangsuensis]